LIQNLPDCDKINAGIRICFEAALWGGCSPSCSYGILRSTEMELAEAALQVAAEEAEEEEESSDE
jgi:hypothetical protein